MTDTNTGRLHRLRYTPLRDLLRGRASGRLDWRNRIAESGLPPAVRSAVARIVRSMRLSRGEKCDVATELIAHFADGLNAGVDADTLVRDFGDERTTARLIRRAKWRQRPLVWQAWTYALRAAAVLAAIYAVLFVRFLIGRPAVSVDYVARLNASTESVAADDRAWPLYRQAILSLGLAASRRDPTLFERVNETEGGDSGYIQIIDATPADPAGWRTLTAWLDAHQDGLAVVRKAAARPEVGFILGPSGSALDPELGWTAASTAPADDPGGGVIAVLVPHLTPKRHMVNLLTADARYALEQNRVDRWPDDIEAILNMGDQRDTPMAISQIVAVGHYEVAFQEVAAVLRTKPHLLSDRQLIALAHRISRVGGDTAASLFSPNRLAAERMMIYDLVQRTFTDDGHGDGRITRAGLQKLAQFFGPAIKSYRDVDIYLPLFGIETYDLMEESATSLTVASRRELLDAYDRLMDETEADLTVPRRELAPDSDPERLSRRSFADRRHDLWVDKKLWPLSGLIPGYERIAVTAERLLGTRDGLVVAIALELHRRRHGQYPATLEAMTPTLLPRVPLDRIDGRPVRYRLIDGRPVVYSVGDDGDDDAARRPVDRNGNADLYGAAQWPGATHPKQPVTEGDWVLFDGRGTNAEPSAAP
ncbi:MAG TPA: hypothetical protein VF595_15845 [Tepidisphaeraceae bacterium]